MKFLRNCAVAFLSLMTSVSHASLIDRGIHTLDTETGLEWLDLSATYTRSYNSVVDNLRPGGLYDGYRYANRSEVTNFFLDAGLTFGADYNNPDRRNFDRYVVFQNLVGITFEYTPANNFGLVGADTAAIFSGDLPHTFGYSLVEAIDYSRAFTQDGARGYSTATIIDPVNYPGNGFATSWGSWLVKNSAQVPEPTTFFLFLAGAIALMVRRKPR